MYKKELLNLTKNDPVLVVIYKDLLKKGIVIEWREKEEIDLFYDLVDAIISQQLSGKAAATIFGRFKNYYGKRFPTPKEILTTPDEKLRGLGVSWAKVKYIKSLSEHIEQEIIDLGKLDQLSDEEVIQELTKVKGIGKWTAEMVLIFSLKRKDVFSLSDLGLRKAVSNIYGVEIDDYKKIEKISKKWSPYRSFACRILWKSLE